MRWLLARLPCIFIVVREIRDCPCRWISWLQDLRNPWSGSGLFLRITAHRDANQGKEPFGGWNRPDNGLPRRGNCWSPDWRTDRNGNRLRRNAMGFRPFG